MKDSSSCGLYLRHQTLKVMICHLMFNVKTKSTFLQLLRMNMIIKYLIVLPILLNFTPGPQISIALWRHFFATSTSRLPSLSTFPTRNVSHVSPWNPFANAC